MIASPVTDEGGGEMVALTVRVPRDLRQRLRVFAAEHEVSVQQCTTEAVLAWLAQQEQNREERP